MLTKFNFRILSLLVTLCLFQNLEANSAKALGMGNTAAAYPQDSLASTYNPASALSVGDRADIWVSGNYSPYSAIIHNSPVSNANVHADGRRTWTMRSAFGVTRQLCLEACPQVAIGFVAYDRFFHKTHYNEPLVLLGTTKLGRSYEQYCISGVAAMNWQAHQFGISLDFLIGRHKVTGLQKLDHHAYTVAKGRITSRGFDTNYGLGVTIGWLWNICPDVKVGISFRPETKMTRFHKYKGFIPEHGVFHNPQRMISGLSWRCMPSTTLSADFEYIWLRRLRADKNPGTSALKNRFGSKHGPAFGLNNDLIIHTGLDYMVTPELTLRAGYIYEREVQRKCQAFWDILYCSPIQNYITIGATYSCNEQLEIDFFYQHGFERSIKNRRAIPHFFGGGQVKMRRSLDRFGIGVGYIF